MIFYNFSLSFVYLKTKCSVLLKTFINRTLNTCQFEFLEIRLIKKIRKKVSLQMIVWKLIFYSKKITLI